MTDRSIPYPDAEKIIRAYHTNINHVKKTPVLTSTTLNKLTSGNLFFKCENFQKAGAFKFRGAHYSVSQLSEEEKYKGVCTHSSGNHAQALSLAAKIHNVNAYIVMPEDAPLVKVEAVKEYGGKITFCKPGLKSRETTLQTIQDKTGATFIHPYDNLNVITGQATCCYEFINQVEIPLHFVVVPVGGGGLTCGTALSANYFSPKTKIIAAEPEGANDAWQSFLQKKWIPSNNPKTIADGLKTSLGYYTYPIIKDKVADILTVDDKQILKSMQWVWERMKIIIEPSAAVSLAVVIENKEIFRNKNVGIIFSGGNVDFGAIMQHWNQQK